ncbi:GFA family protein [Sagittula sp. S175]|uniref:GFA family protein n=1 Tax=Sagittula sp. S175 TaxID=3415129 RepID=UPI003C7BF553
MRGSCLCGAVSFTVTGGPAAFYLCHCSRCRKGSGSAHAANLFVPGGQIAWSGGPRAHYAVPESRHQRCFCPTCGSALPVEATDLLVIPAGALDTPVALRPAAHICCADRAEWDHDLNDVPNLPGLPG